MANFRFHRLRLWLSPVRRGFASGSCPVAGADHRPNGVVKVTATRWKLSSAIVGGSALIAMGALGVGFGDGGVTGSGNFLIPAAPQATATTTPPAAPVTTLATPAVTTSTPAGFGLAS
jgi:hypothetical protein